MHKIPFPKSPKPKKIIIMSPPPHSTASEIASNNYHEHIIDTAPRVSEGQLTK